MNKKQNRIENITKYVAAIQSKILLKKKKLPTNGFEIKFFVFLPFFSSFVLNIAKNMLKQKQDFKRIDIYLVKEGFQENTIKKYAALIQFYKSFVNGFYKFPMVIQEILMHS